MNEKQRMEFKEHIRRLTITRLAHVMDDWIPHQTFDELVDEIIDSLPTPEPPEPGTPIHSGEPRHWVLPVMVTTDELARLYGAHYATNESMDDEPETFAAFCNWMIRRGTRSERTSMSFNEKTLFNAESGKRRTQLNDVERAITRDEPTPV